MVGMAGAAFKFFNAAVEAGFLLDIPGCFFMAIQAEFGLSGFVEFNVAVGTVGFQFGMARNYFPRNQNALKTIGVSACNETEN